MRNPTLELDFTGCIDGAGLTESDLDELAERARGAIELTLQRHEAGDVRFLDIPDDRALARRLMDRARDLPPEIDTMIVLGPASAGPRALYSALARPFDQLRSRFPGMPRRLFFADSLDPERFASLLKLCPAERTLFNIPDATDSSAQVVAQLAATRAHLEKRLGAHAAAQHLVVTADENGGSGPREPCWFSVLGAVGLMPAAVAGLDVMGLLDGAQSMRDRVSRGPGCGDIRRNPALLLASLLYLQHTRRGRPVLVAEAVGDALADSVQWLAGLFSASLSRAGESADLAVSPIAIAARGAADPSWQPYVRGNDDKTFLFLSVRERGMDVAIPEGATAALTKHRNLTRATFSGLMASQLRQKIAAMRALGRPHAVLLIDRLSAQAMGELIMLLQATVAFAGALYGIDPFAGLHPEWDESLADAGERPPRDSRYVFSSRPEKS